MLIKTSHLVGPRKCRRLFGAKHPVYQGKGGGCSNRSHQHLPKDVVAGRSQQPLRARGATCRPRWSASISARLCRKKALKDATSFVARWICRRKLQTNCVHSAIASQSQADVPSIGRQNRGGSRCDGSGGRAARPPMGELGAAAHCQGAVSRRRAGCQVLTGTSQEREKFNQILLSFIAICD